MAKAPAIHLANPEGKNICSYKAKAPTTTNLLSEVTCKRCLAQTQRDAEPAEQG